MPELRRPHVASPDELKITRARDTAIFEYADPRIATTHFTMQPGLLATMTDPELLAYWNEHIAATDEFIRNQKFNPTAVQARSMPTLGAFLLSPQKLGARDHLLLFSTGRSGDQALMKRLEKGAFLSPAPDAGGKPFVVMRSAVLARLFR